MRGDLNEKEKQLRAAYNQAQMTGDKEKVRELAKEINRINIIKSGNFRVNNTPQRNTIESEEFELPEDEEVDDGDDNYDEGDDTGGSDDEQFGEPIGDEPEEKDKKKDNAGEAERKELEEQSLGQDKQQQGAELSKKETPQDKANKAPESGQPAQGDTASKQPEKQPWYRRLGRNQKKAGEEALKSGAVGKAKKEAKKEVKKLASQAAKAALNGIRALYTNPATGPYAWGITIGIIVLILAIAIIFAIVINKNSVVSERGQTITQPVDPLTGKEWIKKVLAFSGDKNVIKQLQDGVIRGLESDLEKLSKENISPDAQAKITEINQNIILFQNAPELSREKIGLKIIDGVKSLIKLLRVIPVYPGQAVFPIKESVTPGNTPHGKSLTHPNGTANHHDVVYTSFNPTGKCDAVDIVIPSSKWGGNKVDVYPIFNGTVIERRKLMNTSANTDVIVFQDSNGYKALYTDIVSGDYPKVGDQVTTDKPIGKVMNKLIHVQVSYNGICLVTTQEENAEWISKGGAFGRFMLASLKSTFKLQ